MQSVRLKDLHFPQKLTFIAKITTKTVTLYSAHERWSSVNVVKKIIVYYNNSWSLRTTKVICEKIKVDVTDDKTRFRKCININFYAYFFFYLKGMIYRTPNFLFAFVGVYECRFEPSPGKACEFFLKNLIYISGQKVHSSFRSSHQRCSMKKGVLKKFANYAGKHLCLGQVFSCEFSEISKNTSFTEYLWRTASVLFGSYIIANT